MGVDEAQTPAIGRKTDWAVRSDRKPTRRAAEYGYQRERSVSLVRLGGDTVDVLTIWRKRKTPIGQRRGRRDLYVALRRHLFEPEALAFGVLRDVDHVPAVGRDGSECRPTGVRESSQLNIAEWRSPSILRDALSEN